MHATLGTCLALAYALAQRTLPSLKSVQDHHTLQTQWVPSFEALDKMLASGLMRFDKIGMPFSDFLQARHLVPWACCKAGLQEDGQHLWTPVDQVK